MEIIFVKQTRMFLFTRYWCSFGLLFTLISIVIAKIVNIIYILGCLILWIFIYGYFPNCKLTEEGILIKRWLIYKLIPWERVKMVKNCSVSSGFRFRRLEIRYGFSFYKSFLVSPISEQLDEVIEYIKTNAKNAEIEL